MFRIDIASWRKAPHISQQNHATELAVTQSVLSAIENGRSRLPADKKDRLAEIFGQEQLDKFTYNEPDEGQRPSDPQILLSDSELVGALLRVFHSQEHKDDAHTHMLHHERMDEMQTRIDRLLERNDALAARNVQLQDRLDALGAEHLNLQHEVFRLKEILLRSNIDF